MGTGAAHTSPAQDQESQNPSMRPAGAQEAHPKLRSYWQLLSEGKESLFIRGVALGRLPTPHEMTLHRCTSISKCAVWALKTSWEGKVEVRVRGVDREGGGWTSSRHIICMLKIFK